MKGTMRRRFGAAVLVAAAVWLSLYPVFAQSPEDEEVRRILEKSLSVVELDKEINQIAEQRKAAGDQLERSQAELERQEQAMNSQREDAGSVLRAYYMGDRDILMTALLSSNSLGDLLTMLDYFELIFANDQRLLNTYVTQYRKVKKTVARLDEEAAQLTQIETRLKAQRERLLALQQDVDNQVSGRSDEERLRLMIQEMTDFWSNVGFYEVKRYFKALATAMKNMPDWVQNNKDMLTIDGLNYTLTIPETKLNEFLREQNEMFNNFEFSFEDNAVSVSGKREGLEVTITGHYTIEDKPNNGILFHVDELNFNGLALPDTTRQALEEEFDLGFYPQKIVSFLKAKSVSVEEGRLIVKLSVSL
ncbi:coiled-coil domain-containing protein [Paenibacillus spongiae]|uniref:N-terminal domain of peptidoglycan hydrolase CwlO-containing protein n=1 Tax=Paenibacillus spongiae TaxID=2909671 RepID=A0ABY5SDY2_9BACL|nr:hypothetical protein [Paenibacillus spongiae]UVI32177.1 hypothetical protein L1F29_10315 [Paenibacillus spongiae]